MKNLFVYHPQTFLIYINQLTRVSSNHWYRVKFHSLPYQKRLWWTLPQLYFLFWSIRSFLSKISGSLSISFLIMAAALFIIHSAQFSSKWRTCAKKKCLSRTNGTISYSSYIFLIEIYCASLSRTSQVDGLYKQFSIFFNLFQTLWIITLKLSHFL